MAYFEGFKILNFNILRFLWFFVDFFGGSKISSIFGGMTGIPVILGRGSEGAVSKPTK